jgi:hypothetical protein
MLAQEMVGETDSQLLSADGIAIPPVIPHPQSDLLNAAEFALLFHPPVRCVVESTLRAGLYCFWSRWGSWCQRSCTGPLLFGSQ